MARGGARVLRDAVSKEADDHVVAVTNGIHLKPLDPRA